ncbi:MAG TPA: trans-aconitate methyltransferase [Firmicutes bacterium]|nr:trans-aconitate methyltransferase [Bacillota bacterium]
MIDIGCGPGNSTWILHNRWPDAQIYGLDNSQNMLDKAKIDYPDIGWLLMDSSDNLSSLGKFDIVFSNAALQWMPEHESLIPRLFSLLANGGVLAVQVPYTKHLPIYSEIIKMIQPPKWSAYFEKPPAYPRHFALNHYYDILCDVTKDICLWQTDYIHIMTSHSDMVEWYKGTGLRPFLDILPDDHLKQEFSLEYLHHLSKAYPIEKDGKVLLPFTRIFFLAYNKL